MCFVVLMDRLSKNFVREELYRTQKPGCFSGELPRVAIPCKGNCVFFFATVSFQFADFLQPGIVMNIVSVVFGILFICDIGISVFCFVNLFPEYACFDSCTWPVIAGVCLRQLSQL